ncbi:MAG: YdcH family protein [Paracoccaceae bacterium]
MNQIPHEIAEEFPEEADIIRALKLSDANFERLLDQYNQVNENLHRSETNIEPVDENHAIELRKTRMQLKDQIWQLISKASDPAASDSVL